MTIAITVLVAVLIQLTLHWAPWHKLLGHELHRLVAYALGTAGIAFPFSAYLLLGGRNEEALVFWLVIIGCGAAVTTAYMIDATLEARARAHIAEEAERLMKREQDAA